MYSNISPYICCNKNEFQDELDYLENNTFIKLKAILDQLNVSFEPINITWDENDEIAQNGDLLRLLLHNIENCSPFFVCLLGEQYGSHNEEIKQNKFLSVRQESDLSSKQFEGGLKRVEKSNDLFIPTTRRMNWIEKNLIVAQKTGYSYVVNTSTQYCSLLELQLQAALFDEKSYEFYKFYFRQPEYLENKFKNLNKQEKIEVLRKYSVENEYCEFKMKDLKARIAKKGLSIKYYQTLEQLDELIIDDFFTTVKSKIN